MRVLRAKKLLQNNSTMAYSYRHFFLSIITTEKKHITPSKATRPAVLNAEIGHIRYIISPSFISNIFVLLPISRLALKAIG